jgi:hypothetical protein
MLATGFVAGFLARPYSERTGLAVATALVVVSAAAVSSRALLEPCAATPAEQFSSG